MLHSSQAKVLLFTPLTKDGDDVLRFPPKYGLVAKVLLFTTLTEDGDDVLHFPPSMVW